MEHFACTTVSCGKKSMSAVMMGAVLGTYGISFLVLGVLLASESVPLLSIPFFLLGFGVLVPSARLLLRMWEKILLVPEGIAITLGSKTLIRYPRKEIGLLAGVEWWEKDRTQRLGICTYSPAEMVQLREQKLQNGLFTRNELIFRKRAENWQQEFQKEFLLGRARFEWFSPWKRDILWLDFDPELMALLKYLYPEIPAQYLRRKGDGFRSNSDWKDPDRMTFRRGQKEDGQMVLLPILIVCWLLVLLYGPIAKSDSGLLVLVVILLAVLAWAAYLNRGSTDCFCLSSAGIRITRGKKEHAALFAGEIRTIIKYDGGVGWQLPGRVGALISTVSSEDLAQRALKQSDSLPHSILTQIPGWQRCALWRLCLKRNFHQKNGDCQTLLLTRQREQTLRELFPDAQWIDVTAKGLYPDA